MSSLDTGVPAARPGVKWRQRLVSLGATGLLLAGMLLAIARPPWLVEPLQAAVNSAGAAAPVVFVLLTALATPLHLNGVLVALSTVTWPLPVAAALSYTGSVLGSVGTAALMVRLGGAALRRNQWPAWLQQLATRVSSRPLVLGLLPRIALGSGLALEGFYVLAGYSRRNYVVVTLVGVAIWTTQTLLGVTVLHALLQRSPGFAIVAAIVPIMMLGVGIALQRARRRCS